MEIKLNAIPSQAGKMSDKTAGSCSIVPSPHLLHSPIPVCGGHAGVVKTRVKADHPPLPKGDGAQRTQLCQLQVETLA